VCGAPCRRVSVLCRLPSAVPVAASILVLNSLRCSACERGDIHGAPREKSVRATTQFLFGAVVPQREGVFRTQSTRSSTQHSKSTQQSWQRNGTSARRGMFERVMQSQSLVPCRSDAPQQLVRVAPRASEDHSTHRPAERPLRFQIDDWATSLAQDTSHANQSVAVGPTHARGVRACRCRTHTAQCGGQRQGPGREAYGNTAGGIARGDGDGLTG
jgi:hypothetical protein